MQVSQTSLDRDSLEPSDSPESGAETVSLRNYDATEAHTLAVTVTNPSGDTVIDRSVPVGPFETVSIQGRPDRAIYHVGVTSERGASDSAECSLGGGPGECAVVEIGNGTVSVTDGHW